MRARIHQSIAQGLWGYALLAGIGGRAFNSAVRACIWAAGAAGPGRSTRGRSRHGGCGIARRRGARAASASRTSSMDRSPSVVRAIDAISMIAQYDRNEPCMHPLLRQQRRDARHAWWPARGQVTRSRVPPTPGHRPVTEAPCMASSSATWDGDWFGRSRHLRESPCCLWPPHCVCQAPVRLPNFRSTGCRDDRAADWQPQNGWSIVRASGSPDSRGI